MPGCQDVATGLMGYRTVKEQEGPTQMQSLIKLAQMEHHCFHLVVGDLS